MAICINNVKLNAKLQLDDPENCTLRRFPPKRQNGTIAKPWNVSAINQGDELFNKLRNNGIEDCNRSALECFGFDLALQCSWHVSSSRLSHAIHSHHPLLFERYWQTRAALLSITTNELRNMPPRVRTVAHFDCRNASGSPQGGHVDVQLGAHLNYPPTDFRSDRLKLPCGCEIWPKLRTLHDFHTVSIYPDCVAKPCHDLIKFIKPVTFWNIT